MKRVLVLAACLAACSGTDGPGSDSGGNTGGTGAGFGGAGPGGTGGPGGNGFGGTNPGTGGMGSGATAGVGGDTGVGGTKPGSGGDAGTTSTGGVGGTGPEPPIAPACAGAQLYEVPEDPSVFGPWPVGVRTVTVPITGGTLTAEIWYPAARGSEAGQAKATYDLTKWLWSDATKVPADRNRLAECNCYRDLPIDAAHGPYPGVVFVHGLASLRVASASTMVHWASRGFVVIAADHWGMYLSDVIGCPGKPTGPAQNVDRDITALIGSLTNHTGDLSFLGSSVDMTRIGLSGHSMGGQAVGAASTKPNVQVVMPIAQLGSAGITASGRSALFACGMSDAVNNYTTATKAGYNATTGKKRLVGITAANHLDVTDLCMEKNNQGETAVQVALAFNVCNPLTLGVVAALGQCGTMQDPSKGPAITTYVTTAALEETLHCRDRSAAFESLKTKYPQVGEFLQSP